VLTLSIENAISKIIPHQLENAFADFLQATRTIEVSKLKSSDRAQLEMFPDFIKEGIQNPEGLKAEAHEKWLASMDKQYPAEMATIRKAAEVYWGTMRDQVNQLHQES
jgi:hypothetical protein